MTIVQVLIQTGVVGVLTFFASYVGCRIGFARGRRSVVRHEVDQVSLPRGKYVEMSQSTVRFGRASDVWFSMCPHCHIAWPIKSLSEQTFLPHPRVPKGKSWNERIDCEGSNTIPVGAIVRNDDCPIRFGEF